MVALLLSALGVRPMAANDLSSDEEFLFFPTSALLDPTAASVTFSVHGWCYEPKRDSKSRQKLLDLLVDKFDFDQQDATGELFRDRAARFLFDNEGGQKLILRLGTR